MRAEPPLPLGVGFGISDPDTAARMAPLADAVIVGSALVKRMEERVNNPDTIIHDVPAFLASLRAAMDAGMTAPVAGGKR